MRTILLISLLFFAGCACENRTAPIKEEVCEGCCCVECVKDCNTNGNCKCQPTNAEMNQAAEDAAGAVLPVVVF